MLSRSTRAASAFLPMLFPLLALLASGPIGAQSSPPFLDHFVSGPPPAESSPQPGTGGEVGPTVKERLESARETESKLREELDRAERIAEEDRETQVGATPELLDRYIDQLTKARYSAALHVSKLEELQRVSASLEDIEERQAAFAGPETEPPYDITTLDSQRAEVKARLLDQDLAQFSLGQARDTWSEARDELEEVRQQLRTVQAEQAGDSSDPHLIWRRNVAVARVARAQAEEGAARSTVDLLEKTVELTERELGLERRRLAIIEQNLNTDADALNQELDARLTGLTQSREEAEADLRTAEARLAQAEEDLAWLRRRSERGGTETARELRGQLETARTEAETWQRIVEVRRDLLNALDLEQDLVELRYEVLKTEHPDRLEEVIRAADAIAHQIDQWRSINENRLAALRTRIANVAEELRLQGQDSANASARLDSLRRREMEISGALDRYTRLKQVYENIRQDAHQGLSRVPLSQRLASLWNRVVRVWNFVIFHYGQEPNIKQLTVASLVVALLVFVVGLMVSRFITRLFRRVALGRFQLDPSVSAVIEKLLYYTLVVIVALYALSVVDMDLTIFGFFGGALAIGVGFGAQTLINNFISGLILFIERPIKIGDIVEVDNQYGRIMNIGARSSRLQLFSGVDILVPNSSFLEKNVINWTLSDSAVRFSVKVGIAYGSPTRESAKLIERAVTEHGRVFKHPAPVVIFQDFGDNALLFEVFFWTEVTTMLEAYRVCSDIRFRIDNLFREAGIVIAFPQRDTHLDTASPLQIQIVDRGPNS